MSTTAPTIAIESRLRAERLRRRLRLCDLSWLISETTGQSVHKSTLSLVERGQSRLSPKLKVAVAQALRVDPDWLWSSDDAE
ncbi:MAG: helix-turn-helix domain-containing protein [Actinomycetota bacterium]